MSNFQTVRLTFTFNRRLDPSRVPRTIIDDDWPVAWSKATLALWIESVLNEPGEMSEL